MARRDAAPLIALADRISREGPCAQARDIRKLRAQAIAAVNGGRVPRALQESLLSGVNALVEPLCLPAIPSGSTPSYTTPGNGNGHGQGRGRGNSQHGEGDD